MDGATIPDFPNSEHHSSKGYITYTTIPGFFKQDDPKVDARTFDYVHAASFRLADHHR